MSSHSSLVIIQLVFKLSVPFIFLYDLLSGRQSDVFDRPCVELIVKNSARGVCAKYSMQKSSTFTKTAVI